MSGIRMLSRIALITGGGTGMGAAIAHLFAKERAKVFLVGRREKPLRETVSKIKYDGYDAGYACADVTDSNELKDPFKAANSLFGTIDCLVNCAGVVNRLEDPTDFAEEEWQKLIDTNIKGTFISNKLALENMIKHNTQGTIVNIASISAHRATSGYATYSATKGAVISYTRVIALQYASYGIRANCISPGVVDTPMGYVDRENYDDMKTRLDQIHPLGRMGIPEDIAHAALFLSCEESSWITGQDLIVDGGLTLE